MREVIAILRSESARHEGNDRIGSGILNGLAMVLQHIHDTEQRAAEGLPEPIDSQRPPCER